MGDHFRGSNIIQLQPGDTSVPFRFQFTVASSSGKSDGALPNGSTVVSCVADAHRGNDGVAVTTGDLVHSNTDFSYDGNTAVIPLTYSSTIGAGTYHLSINVTASINGTTSDLFIKQFDFNRISVRDV